MLKRVKQFFLYFSYKVNKEDIEFINKYLNEKQIELFSRLKIHEQKHCINVARDISEHCERLGIEGKKELIVAALLHDIGKIEYKLNLIDKSALVILDKISKGEIKRYKNIKKIDIYYNHPEKGYKILKDIGEDSRVLYLVRNHHNNKISEDLELNMLKKSDDEN